MTEVPQRREELTFYESLFCFFQGDMTNFSVFEDDDARMFYESLSDLRSLVSTVSLLSTDIYVSINQLFSSDDTCFFT